MSIHAVRGVPDLSPVRRSERFWVSGPRPYVFGLLRSPMIDGPDYFNNFMCIQVEVYHKSWHLKKYFFVEWSKILFVLIYNKNILI